MKKRNKFNTIIQLGFIAYMVDRWIDYKTPGLKETTQTFYLELYRILTGKVKNTNAIKNGKFKPSILNSIHTASIHLSGRYDMDNPLVYGTIQCMLINCYEMSGQDMKREFKKLQELIENCIALIDYDFFNETNRDEFIKISEYLKEL